MLALAPVLDDAPQTALWRGRDDRDRFVPALRVVEDFVREKKRVIGGAAATRMILSVQSDEQKDLPLDMYHYLIYSPNPAKDCNELARRVYSLDPQGLTQYTASFPRAGGAEASLIVSQREIARLVGLPRHRGVSVYEMLVPDQYPPLFSGKEAPCLGPEVQLLETYIQLCNPELAGSWGALLSQERKLRASFLSEFCEKSKGIVEGGAAPKKRSGLAKKSREDFLALLSEDFLGKEGRIEVTLPAGGAKKTPARRACTSLYSLQHEQKALTQLAGRAKVNIHVLVNDPQLVVDVRLRRLTAYIQTPGQSREPVLDIYNVANYEAVPFLFDTARGRYGTAFVLARFLLVDMWTIQLLWRMGSISDQYTKQQLAALFKQFQKLEPQLDDPETAFPQLPTHFLGRIENPDLAQKRAALDVLRRGDGKSRRRYRPFFPARFAASPDDPADESANEQEPE